MKSRRVRLLAACVLGLGLLIPSAALANYATIRGVPVTEGQMRNGMPQPVLG